MRKLVLHSVQKYTALKSQKVCRLLKGKNNMKFKTRLRVTFISIILLPLLLTIMAFVMIAIYLMNYSQGFSLTDIDYSMMSENFREFTNTTDQAYYVLLDQVKEDSRQRIYRHEGQFADLETSADRYVCGYHSDPDLHQPDADPVDPQGRI